MINLDDLPITQDGLREYDIADMIEFVRNGGVYTQSALDEYNCKQGSNLIILNRFEDGRAFLHDGHHRAASIYLSGTRDFLYPEEITYHNYTYRRYRTANFGNGWYTPFDPRTHVRIPDFFDIKNKIRTMSEVDPKKALAYLADHNHEYVVPRKDRHNHISGILDSVTTT